MGPLRKSLQKNFQNSHKRSTGHQRYTVQNTNKNVLLVRKLLQKVLRLKARKYKSQSQFHLWMLHSFPDPSSQPPPLHDKQWMPSQHCEGPSLNDMSDGLGPRLKRVVSTTILGVKVYSFLSLEFTEQLCYRPPTPYVIPKKTNK